MKQREQEQEMDDELRELLLRQEELKKKLHEEKEPTTSASASASTSKTKTGKGKGKKSSKNVLNKFNTEIQVADDGLAATLANTVNNTIPTLAQIKDMLHVSDKRTKVKKARRTSKKQRYSKKKYDTSDSDSSSSSYVDSSSSEQSSDEEDDPKRRKRGKSKQSGLYAKAGNVRIVSGEVFAHTALDDELGERELASLPFHLLVAGKLEIIADEGIK